MEAKLTPAGQKKYKEAQENFRLSDELLDQIEFPTAKKDTWEKADEKATRGRSLKLTNKRLCEMLGARIWYERKLYRVFKGEASLTEAEARHLCKTLRIDFAPDDFEAKRGPAAAQPFRSQDSVPPSLNSAPDWAWDSTIDTERKRTGLVACETRKDDKVVLEAREPIEAQLRCNPTPLRATVSEGSIPDPFASSDFHLKVRLEVPDTAMVLDQSPTGAASWTCTMLCGLYQGQGPMDLLFMTTAGLSMDPFYFNVDKPDPLIDRVKRLLKVAREDCWYHHSNSPNSAAPLRVHLHLLLPLTCLSGPLPETIQKRLGAERESLGRQVFFACSDRAELGESAVTQLHSQSTKVNQRLYSGDALSSLKWATVYHQASQPVAFDQFFHASEKILHLKASSLDSEARNCDLVGRDALFATDQSLLFVDRLSSAGKGSGNADVCRRWERLVEIGMPLVLIWRDGTESLSQNFERLGRVFGASWSTLCGHLDRLDKVLESSDELALEMRSLVAKLGIFYEEPLRCLPRRFHPLSSFTSCE